MLDKRNRFAAWLKLARKRITGGEKVVVKLIIKPASKPLFVLNNTSNFAIPAQLAHNILF